MSESIATALREGLERFAQLHAWYNADHECGGKDRGVCGLCDVKADYLLRDGLAAVVPVVERLLAEQERERYAVECDYRKRLVALDERAAEAERRLREMTEFLRSVCFDEREFSRAEILRKVKQLALLDTGAGQGEK